MSNPTAGGSYIRQKDGTLKRVEETAQLGSERHEGLPPEAEPAPAADSKPRAARQKE